jgi:hypothetical protein
VVIFGFGTHEVPDDGSRARLFEEARRVLKLGGKVLMFEHGNDFHNVIIFGPVVNHVVARAEWMVTFQQYFDRIGYQRTSEAVDLFWGTKAQHTGTVVRPLPRTTGRRDSLANWLVVGLFSLISLGVVAYLPEAHLVAIYWAIAVLGLTWPWFMIAVAIVGDWLTRRGSGDTPPSALA